MIGRLLDRMLRPQNQQPALHLQQRAPDHPPHWICGHPACRPCSERTARHQAVMRAPLEQRADLQRTASDPWTPGPPGQAVQRGVDELLARSRTSGPLSDIHGAIAGSTSTAEPGVASSAVRGEVQDTGKGFRYLGMGAARQGGK